VLVVVTLQPSFPLLVLQFAFRSVSPAAEPAMFTEQPGFECKVSLNKECLLVIHSLKSSERKLGYVQGCVIQA